MKWYVLFSQLLLITDSYIQGAKILAVFPFPSISHQIVFRKLTLELMKRGHEVTVVTTDPAFPKGQTPQNFTEIDLHDVSYKTWRSLMQDNYRLSRDLTSFKQLREMSLIMMNIFDKQLEITEFQELIFSKEKPKFDLLLIESVIRPAIALSHIFKIPVILINSLGAVFDNNDVMGLPSHPLLYPANINRRLYDLTDWEKFVELFFHFSFKYVSHNNEAKENSMLQKHFGPDIPSIRELYNNVDMLFLNVHPIWTDNQPVPQSVVFMGGIHQNEPKPLPQDLQNFLDSSKHGVVYVSFGTNILADMISPNVIQIIVKVLSTLPYDVLWKWDKDELPGRSNNIKISKWLPQADLLRHPKIKVFITQAGLQSTDEAITAGVPLIAFPMLGDQWYNAEKYVRHGIGIKFSTDDITEEVFRNSIISIINNNGYRDNVKRLRKVMLDQPQTPLARSVWWIEYVLRHGGAKHLKAAGANIPWSQYYEIEFVTNVFVWFILLTNIFIRGFKYISGVSKDVIIYDKKIKTG